MSWLLVIGVLIIVLGATWFVLSLRGWRQLQRSYADVESQIHAIFRASLFGERVQYQRGPAFTVWLFPSDSDCADRCVLTVTLFHPWFPLAWLSVLVDHYALLITYQDADRSTSFSSDDLPAWSAYMQGVIEHYYCDD